MSETGIKVMLEFIVPRLIRMLVENHSLTENEALTHNYSVPNCIGSWRGKKQSYGT